MGNFSSHFACLSIQLMFWDGQCLVADWIDIVSQDRPG